MGLNITGIILAAGISSRMGRNKLLLEYLGHTVIEETISQMLDSKVTEIIVVTGYESESIDDLISRYTRKRLKKIHNSNYKSGRAESIKCAVESLDRGTDAALFMVADKPGVTSDLIDRSIDEFNKARPGILYIKTPAGRGHPIIFSRELFGELLALEGDVVGDQLIARYKENTVELYDEKIQVDIDTEEDYIRLMRELPKE